MELVHRLSSIVFAALLKNIFDSWLLGVGSMVAPRATFLSLLHEFQTITVLIVEFDKYFEAYF